MLDVVDVGTDASAEHFAYVVGNIAAVDVENIHSGSFVPVRSSSFQEDQQYLIQCHFHSVKKFDCCCFYWTHFGLDWNYFGLDWNCMVGVESNLTVRLPKMMQLLTIVMRMVSGR